MKIALVQFENRLDEAKGVRPFIRLLVERNREVAQKLGWDYRLGLTADLKRHKKTHGPHHPIWSKVFFLNSLKGYDALIWIDSDAVIHSSRRFNYLLNRPEDFIYAPDPPYFTSAFNTGVFIVKKPAFCFLKAWQSAFHSPYCETSCSGGWLQEQRAAARLLNAVEHPPHVEVHKHGLHKAYIRDKPPAFLDECDSEALSITRLRLPWYSFHGHPEWLAELPDLPKHAKEYDSLLNDNGLLKIDEIHSRVGAFHILNKSINYEKYLNSHSIDDV